MKGGRKEMFEIFKESLSFDSKNKGGEAHKIKYGEWYDTNRT